MQTPSGSGGKCVQQPEGDSVSSSCFTDAPKISGSFLKVMNQIFVLHSGAFLSFKLSTCIRMYRGRRSKKKVVIDV